MPGGTAGSGRTVAIVDAYDDPTAESDLAAYRSAYGLPTCTTANGCFRKVDEHGRSRIPAADSGWASEISLDLDMVSATCPNCRILLVEAASASFTDLGTGVNTAVALGARYVSNSYGGAEFSTETGADRNYFNHPGVVITEGFPTAGMPPFKLDPADLTGVIAYLRNMGSIDRASMKPGDAVRHGISPEIALAQRDGRGRAVVALEVAPHHVAAVAGKGYFGEHASKARLCTCDSLHACTFLKRSGAENRARRTLIFANLADSG